MAEAAGYTTYLGEVTDPDEALTWPFAVVWLAPAVRTSQTLSGTVSTVMTTTQVTVVGRDIDEVLAAADRIAAQVHGQRPTAAGRQWGQARQVPGGAPPQPDRSVTTPQGRPAFRAALLFELMSTAAPPA